MDEVNALLADLHRLGCAPVIRTHCLNNNPAEWEVSVTWTRLLGLPGYSRPFSEQAVRARTLPDALRAALAFEARFDADERARLQKREEVPGGEA